ncbi:hypothetical protein AB4305_03560 [Nocardia sp. 2YAB30]|uniref:hypothetical protein n=1 Tax=unclassified Nocardia TaxID=2637762 RepID=UPI003F96C03F
MSKPRGKDASNSSDAIVRFKQFEDQFKLQTADMLEKSSMPGAEKAAFFMRLSVDPSAALMNKGMNFGSGSNMQLDIGLGDKASASIDKVLPGTGMLEAGLCRKSSMDVDLGVNFGSSLNRDSQLADRARVDTDGEIDSKNAALSTLPSNDGARIESFVTNELGIDALTLIRPQLEPASDLVQSQKEERHGRTRV